MEFMIAIKLECASTYQSNHMLTPQKTPVIKNKNGTQRSPFSFLVLFQYAAQIFQHVCSNAQKTPNDYKVVFLLHVRSLKNLDLPDWKCVFNIEGKWCTGG